MGQIWGPNDISVLKKIGQQKSQLGNEEMTAKGFTWHLSKSLHMLHLKSGVLVFCILLFWTSLVKGIVPCSWPILDLLKLTFMIGTEFKKNEGDKLTDQTISSWIPTSPLCIPTKPLLITNTYLISQVHTCSIQAQCPSLCILFWTRFVKGTVPCSWTILDLLRFTFMIRTNTL